MMVNNIEPIAEERILDILDGTVVDIVEGTLIDNLLVETSDGHLIVFLERYVNCWTSGYTMITGDNNEIEDYWYENIVVYEEDTED